MAGRPVLRALNRRIQAAGGDHVVMEMIADGRTMNEIAAEFDSNRRMIYRWLHADEEREKAWNLARRAAAHALVEDGMDILDALARRQLANGMPVAPESAEVQLAKARAQYRKWLASVRDRDSYGSDQGPAVNVNISAGELHLDALRRKGSAGAQIQEAEYEMIEGDADEPSG